MGCRTVNPRHTFPLVLTGLTWVWVFLLPATPAKAAVAPAALVELINQSRNSQHLRPVVLVPSLTDVAAARLDALERRGNAEHQPEEDIPDLQAVARRFGYVGLVGENISRGLTDPASIVNAWLGSTAHRQTLFEPTFSAVGIAIDNQAGAANGNPLVVLVLAAPATDRQARTGFFLTVSLAVFLAAISIWQLISLRQRRIRPSPR